MAGGNMPSVPLRTQVDEAIRDFTERRDALQERLKNFDELDESDKRLQVMKREAEHEVLRIKNEIEAIRIKKSEVERHIQNDLLRYNLPTSAENLTHGSPDDATASQTQTISSAHTGRDRSPLRVLTKNGAPPSRTATPSSITMDTIVGEAGQNARSPAPNSTTTTARTDQIAQDVERVSGIILSHEQILNIVEQYPHGCFRDGRFYLRKCANETCQANGVLSRGIESPRGHFIQGNIGFIRHIRTHKIMSGVKGDAIDQYCNLGEPIGREDLQLMSHGREPNCQIVINFGKGDIDYREYIAKDTTTNIKRRADVLASVYDTKDESGSAQGNGQVGDDSILVSPPQKRQRKSTIQPGFVPVHAVDDYEEEMY